MTKKTRTVLFLTCSILFLLVAPFIVLYSQGYRLDLENKKFNQTGGLFLKVLPKQAEIYINGKLKEKTDFFFGSILIENLLPRKHKIEVKKAGYYSWQKTLEIKEKKVTEAKNIILFPQNFDFQILTKNVENFWFSPDQTKIILKEKEKDNWSLKLYDLNNKFKIHLINDKDISLKEVDLLNLEFSKDLKRIILETGIGEEIKYFTLSLNQTPPTITEITPPSPPIKDALTYQEVNGDFYYLDKFGYLFKNNDKLTEKAFLIKQETKYNLKVLSSLIFLEEGKTLFLFNPETKIFEKFFEPINYYKISPDSNKLVYSSNYEIWIFYLKDFLPNKRSGDKVFLSRFSEKIKNVYWLNSDYLVFTSGNKIKITEIDERDKINIIDVEEFKNPDIFWDKIRKRLYVLSEGNLYFSRVLLP